MSVVGEVTGVWGLLTKAWDWHQERVDPAFRCANRLIRAFEAHGIKRQQVMRLIDPQALPAKPELTMADFSKPAKLKAKLSPQLLDWAADYLNVQRAWFDDVDVRPHEVVDHYKHPALYRTWLQDRQTRVPDVNRHLCIWKGKGQPLGPDGVGQGPLCLVYEEISDGLDGTELSRYWLLSNGWNLHHAPCIENMVAAVAVAQSLGILVTGRDVPRTTLRRLESGDALLPEAAAQESALWHPEDLVSPLPGKDTAWRQALWQGAQGWLSSNLGG